MVKKKLSTYERDLINECKYIINSIDRKKKNKEQFDSGYYMYCLGFIDAIYKILPHMSSEAFIQVDNYYAKTILNLDVYKHLKQIKNKEKHDNRIS